MNHDTHDDMIVGSPKEYAKFAALILTILSLSLLFFDDLNIAFLDAFMGIFFLTLGSFKLFQLKVFAYGFQNYDLIAKKSLAYAFSYPFIQIAVGGLYLLGFGAIPLDVFVLLLSLVSGAGVLNSLIKKQVVHCVCLGNVIKLPLSRISFVEDFGMALMATAMIFMR